MGPTVKSRNLYSEYLFSQPLRSEKERVERGWIPSPNMWWPFNPRSSGSKHFWSILQSCQCWGECTALYCTTEHCTELHYWSLQCTEILCTAVYCTTDHCTALQCTTLLCTEVWCLELCRNCTAVLCTATIAEQCSTVQYCKLPCTALHCRIIEERAVNRWWEAPSQSFPLYQIGN